MSLTAFLVLSFTSLFAVIDPLGAIPFFSGLTARATRARKRRILVKALIVAFMVLAVFTLAGRELLDLFGITIDAFRIAGGVIFFGIGLDMLQSRPVRWRTGIGSRVPVEVDIDNEDEAEDPSITPLAIPMIAGPGSITTVIILTPQAPVLPGGLLVLAVVAVILIVTGIILAGADALLARVGGAGLKVLEKLMGLLVTVIAVQLMIDGLTPVIRDMVA